jgi:hypothetical protein
VLTDTLRRSLKLKLGRSLQFGSTVPLFRMKILLPLAGTRTKFSCFLSDPYFHPTRHAAFKRNLYTRNNVVSYCTIVLRHSFNILWTELTFNLLSPKPSSHKLQYIQFKVMELRWREREFRSFGICRDGWRLLPLSFDISTTLNTKVALSMLPASMKPIKRDNPLIHCPLLLQNLLQFVTLVHFVPSPFTFLCQANEFKL